MNHCQTSNELPKWLLLPLLASIVAITPLAIDMYLPALTEIAQEFGTDVTVVQQSLSTYLAGYGLGMLCFGYLADKLGRRPLVIFGLSLFSIISLALSFSDNMDMFFVLRFLQAFVGAAATVVIPGYIKEVYRQDTAKGMSYVSLIMMLAPLIAPTIGTIILDFLNWHWIFRILSIYSFLLLCLVLVKLKMDSDKDKSIRTDKGFFAAYKTVFTQQGVRIYIASGVLCSFAFFCYLTASSFIFLEVFAVSKLTFSTLFSLNVGSLMFANVINSRLSPKFGAKTMLKIGILTGIIAASGLTLVNWLQLDYLYTMIFLMPLMGSLGIISVSCDAIVLLKFKNETGTATAVIGTLRFGCGALAGPILALLYTGTAVPFASVMLTSVIVIGLMQLFYTKKVAV